MASIIMVFFYYKPNHKNLPTEYDTLSSLSPYTAGVIHGSNTIPLLKGAGMKIEESKFKQQILKLKAGRIHYAVVGLLAGNEMIKQLFPKETDNFAYMSKPVMELPLTVYFNKDAANAELYAKKFNRGLRKIIRNGGYVTVLEEYYGKGRIPFSYSPLFKQLGVSYPY